MPNCLFLMVLIRVCISLFILQFSPLFFPFFLYPKSWSILSLSEASCCLLGLNYFCQVGPQIDGSIN